MIIAALFACLIVALASSMTEEVSNLRKRMEILQVETHHQNLRHGNEWNLNRPTIIPSLEPTVISSVKPTVIPSAEFITPSPSITFVSAKCNTYSQLYFSSAAFRIDFDTLGMKTVNFSGPRGSIFNWFTMEMLLLLLLVKLRKGIN